MSWPRMTSLIPVTMSASAKTARGNDAGLKMWTRRPPRSQRISLAAKPITARRNWKWKPAALAIDTVMTAVTAGDPDVGTAVA